MAYDVQKMDVWVAEIDDRPGALDEKLAALAAANIDLAFLLARRQPQTPGKGIVFLSGIKGAKAQKAAAAAGLSKASDIFAVRIEGRNKPGACQQITQRVAENGLNLRGVSATVIGNKFAAVFAFDSEEDAKKAIRLIKAIK
ncbi:MAG: hypothetical protein KatS3mg110_2799 [Pirellulaceae bacterium]|nr:MAG: hypothetical protein KatS3mg110_2799 [Pirellulaceae bacterium]